MRTLDPENTVNAAILQKRIAAFGKIAGPRVGDYLRLPNIHPKLGQLTRFTHDHGGHIQTGGMNGSYYFGAGFLSYSGGLDPGVPCSDIGEQCDVRDGSVWFFDEDQSGAGRGVDCMAPMRVFALRPGADLGGIEELRCPFSVIVLDAAGHARTCNYWFLVQKRAMACTAFTTEPELHRWLAENQLKLTKPLTRPGEHSWQNLAYA